MRPARSASVWACRSFRDADLATELPLVVLVGPTASGKSRLAIGLAELLGSHGQPAEVVKRVRRLQTSAFDINLPDNAVDSIFCMRLLHHVGDANHRMALLREFHRVSRDSVIVSLWVDGNFKAWRRKRLERQRADAPEQDSYQNRYVLPAATVEAEFKKAGFNIRNHLDFIPYYAMWRVYVLSKR